MTTAIRFHPTDIGTLVTPPECAGQMIVLSFAAVEGGILRRTYDRADGAITWHFADWESINGVFHPQNRRPRVPPHAWMPCTVGPR